MVAQAGAKLAAGLQVSMRWRLILSTPILFTRVILDSLLCSKALTVVQRGRRPMPAYHVALTPMLVCWRLIPPIQVSSVPGLSGASLRVLTAPEAGMHST